MVNDPLQTILDYGFQLSYFHIQEYDILREEGVQFVKEMSPKNKQNPIPFMLDNHIQKYSKPILPNDLNTATTTLKGKFILQVGLF